MRRKDEARRREGNEQKDPSTIPTNDTHRRYSAPNDDG